jgi:glycosyltransferase involved in cell wall biosynthesis
MIFFPATWNFCDGLGAMVGLRLAYMTGEYPRVTDTFIQREVLALRALGHYVKTFSVRHPPDNESAGEDAAESRRTTIYLLPPRNLVGAHVAQFSRSPRNYFSAFKLAWKNCPPGIKAITRQAAYFAEAGILAQGMAKHSLSHLHNHFADSSCSVASIAAEMGGFTFSFTIHGSDFFEPRFWWIDVKIKQALFVNCVSYYGRSQAMSLTPSDCWEKLRVVHCGVNPSSIEVKKHEGLGHRLLFVGRLAVEKGLPFLLDAVAKVEGAILDVAGDGPERKLLEMKTTRLGIDGRVRFLGYQSQSDVRKLMQQADVFVMTSLSEGIPVVATRIAGVPELVDDGSDGLLVLPGDPDATTAAVCRLLADPELRNRFAIAGRAKVEREFNLQSESSWLVRIMTSALSGGSERVRP